MKQNTEQLYSDRNFRRKTTMNEPKTKTPVSESIENHW